MDNSTQFSWVDKSTTNQDKSTTKVLHMKQCQRARPTIFLGKLIDFPVHLHQVNVNKHKWRNTQILENSLFTSPRGATVLTHVFISTKSVSSASATSTRDVTVLKILYEERVSIMRLYIFKFFITHNSYGPWVNFIYFVSKCLKTVAYLHT